MVINRGGDLSKEYFIAYFNLVMNTRQCSLEEAKAITFERLFKNDEMTLGPISFQRFDDAYDELKVEKV